MGVDAVQPPGPAGGPLAELNDAVDLIGRLDYVEPVGQVGGVAAFRRTDVDPWRALDGLSRALADRRVYRPWDLAPLHTTTLPPGYRVDAPWPTFEVGEAYMIAYFARCGPGPYGHTAAAARADRAFLHALSRDRRDGDVVRLGGLGDRLRSAVGRPASGFRAILCGPDEAAACAPRLQPGGVLIARHDLPPGHESTLAVRRTLLDAGLSGCGCTDTLHWGVWRPEHLSSAAVLGHAHAAHATP